MTLNHWIRSVLDLSAERVYWDCCHSDSRSLVMKESFSMCLPPWEGEDHFWQLEYFFLNLQLPSESQCVQWNSEQQLSSCTPYWNLVVSEGLFVLRSGCELVVCFRGFHGLELHSSWRKCHCRAKSAGALWDAKSLLCYFLLIQVVFPKYKVKEVIVCPFFHLPMQVSCNWQECWILPVSHFCWHGREMEGSEMEPYIPLHLPSEGKVICEH